LWYFGGPPDSPEKLARCFAAVPHRVVFLGHIHRWLLGTPDGVLPWQGETMGKPLLRGPVRGRRGFRFPGPAVPHYTRQGLLKHTRMRTASRRGLRGQAPRCASRMAPTPS
jgi:hypothetical protein